MGSLPNRSAIVAAMESLELGAALILDLPEKQPLKRDTYRQIAGVAHQVFGPGGYRVIGVRSGGVADKITIVRMIGHTGA